MKLKIFFLILLCFFLQNCQKKIFSKPSIKVSWTPNREASVNHPLGGYLVYYSKTPHFDVSQASLVRVPYSSGDQAPTSVVLESLSVGTYFIKVIAYSYLFQSDGGPVFSAPSDEIQLEIPEKWSRLKEN